MGLSPFSFAALERARVNLLDLKGISEPCGTVHPGWILRQPNFFEGKFSAVRNARQRERANAGASASPLAILASAEALPLFARPSDAKGDRSATGGPLFQSCSAHKVHEFNP
jgi:hypothetical protein